MYSRNILIVVAHPDDAELSMGGTIARFLSYGDYDEVSRDIFIYHTTNGIYSDLQNKPVRDEMEILTTLDRVFGKKGHLECDKWVMNNVNATELIVDKESISKLQRFILEHNIEMIFTHPAIDTYHQDHIATHNIVMAAARRYVQRIFCFESIFNYAGGNLQPTMYIPFHEREMQLKERAIFEHKSEVEKFGGKSWVAQIRAMAQYRGAQCNASFAEAFSVMKWTW